MKSKALKSLNVMKALVLVAGMAAAIPLAGCVTLLPKTNPVQMYRFGYEAKKVEKTPGMAPRATNMPLPTSLALGTVELPQESAGDRIATVEGHQISYIADARWASPAQAQFNQAISEGYARTPTNIILQARGPGPAPYRVDITVRKFETSYSHNKPVVVIAFDTRIIRLADRSIVGQGLITAEVPVRKNDMTSIVEGYNVATVRAVDSLIHFSEDTIAKVQMAGAQTLPSAPPPAKGPGQEKVEGL